MTNIERYVLLRKSVGHLLMVLMDVLVMTGRNAGDGVVVANSLPTKLTRTNIVPNIFGAAVMLPLATPLTAVVECDHKDDKNGQAAHN